MTQPPVRVPASGESPQKIDEIALQELAEATHICVRDAYGMERESSIVATARLLGYKSTGVLIRERINAALELSICENRLRDRDGSISIVDGE